MEFYNMKKALLLAGVASLFSFNANAMMGMPSDFRPYVGVDYVYSKADYKGDASRLEDDGYLEDNFNSGVINAGIKMGDYYSIEAFYQQSASEEGDYFVYDGMSHKAETQFDAYGIDLYGYAPVGCDGLSLLGTVGLANYDLEVKELGETETKSRVGYRAGIGAQYDFNENWSARLVGRYSYINTKDVDNLMEATAGIRYTF